MRSIKEVLFGTKQDHLAHDCPLTVITEPKHGMFWRDIPKEVSTIFPELWRRKKTKTRYDLLSLPDLKGVLGDQVRYDLLVEDVLTAIGLHKAEYVAVIAGSDPAVPEGLAERLRTDPRLEGVHVSARTVVRVGFQPDALAVTCMDWRLHGIGGFLPRCAELVGDKGIGLMTIPGVAKELSESTVRGRVTLQVLDTLVHDGLKKLTLVSHTDCGKYGGCGAFSGSMEEQMQLTHDLRLAVRYLRSRLQIDVRLAIASVEKQACAEICGIPLTSPFSFSFGDNDI